MNPNEAPATREARISALVPDPLPLRNIDVPREVTQVEGCDCGGIDWHAEGCPIWQVPRDQAHAAIADAKAREQAFTAELNRKLRLALGQEADRG